VEQRFAGFEEELEVRIKDQYFLSCVDFLVLLVFVKDFLTNDLLTLHFSGKAPSRIVHKETYCSQLAPFVHIDKLLDKTAVVLVDDVDPLRTDFEEGGDSWTSDKILSIAQ
jgi:hypothetical protein